MNEMTREDVAIILETMAGSAGLSRTEKTALETAADMLQDDRIESVSVISDEFDDILKPAHYCSGRKYEPKDVIRDWGLNFNLGNAIKYLSRAGRKNNNDITKDLYKAMTYINFEIMALKEEMKEE